MEPTVPTLGPTPTEGELSAAWNGAAELAPAAKTQMLLDGGNYRVNLVKALGAVFKTAVFCIQAAASTTLLLTSGHISPADALKVISAAWASINSILDAVREKMHPLEYTACVVLASVPEGLTVAEFETRLRSLVTSGQQVKFPFYLGLTESRVAAASEALQDPDGFTDLMKLLKKNDWIEHVGDKIRFKPRNFELGIKSV